MRPGYAGGGQSGRVSPPQQVFLTLGVNNQRSGKMQLTSPMQLLPVDETIYLALQR